MAAKSKVIGGKQAVRDFQHLGKRGRNAMAGAIYLEGTYILADSVPRTPVITSRLRNSQFATIPSASRLAMRVGYGTKYAWSVHEGIKRRIRDQKRSVQRAFWASVGNEQWSTASTRSGAMVGSLWKTSEVGGPKFLEHAADATRGGRSRRVQRSFSRLFAKRLGVPAPTVPRRSGGSE